MENQTESTAAEQTMGKWGEYVTVEFDEGIAWVTLNRPKQRNAINPGIVWEMNAIMDALEEDERCKVMVVTGAGESFSAGMDLKEYFRATDKVPPIQRERLFRANAAWQWRRMMYYPKPTISMVNGWCFGGAFQFLVGCDLAIASEEAIFGLSEINWGIIPAGIVTKSVLETMSFRDAMYYIMTGETFNGRQAAEMKLVNKAVAPEDLKEETRKLAMTLTGKNPFVLRQAKTACRFTRDMSWEQAGEYLMAKSDQTELRDPENGRNVGMSQFLDEKSFRPGLGAYRRD
ncbi:MULTISPECIES: p-hydroxycinnamoyl CoA hydratase/lyase [Rhizobium/Agrobacterium group]|uniref:p-hydroxycinnamoyl CoA hydratase/lyase n=1 Tax=Neorhizobium petrolearium TaxID=515361 RepID=A0ABY8MCK5_9HYPH|nr:MULTISPECIES: p-hydroxycinnamoyl CoA hydratase/lyase [Rhizobium/Agrobacterium group]MCC2613993.1 p-hydroxycinnamoyl CoA hydratase/lyase [Neorhizobium petrolearium]WGI71514.1 p-hydroxycinnamoyl CoA hydratase/lyase [Neorhizobium petrolearium]